MGSTASERGSSCSSLGRGICTSFCVVAWLLVLFGTITTHFAVRSVIGPVKDLPQSLHKGFYEELRFDDLKKDSEKVKSAAFTALATCGVAPSQCGSLPSTAAQADTSVQRAEIQGAFANSLAIIEKVANDPYFGIDKLNSTAADLRKISDQLDSLDTTQCAVTNEGYCNIYSAADGLVAETQEATGAIDQLIDSDEAKYFENNTDRLVLMHLLPYPLVLSMLFFTCFWKKDAACCCCGGSLGGCILLLLQVAFWLVSLVPSMIIVVIAWSFKFGQDRIEVGPPIKGNPTLQQLLEHIETVYPGFWNVVVVPLEGPLNQLYVAAFIMLVACLFIEFYGVCICLCRPYTDKTIE